MDKEIESALIAGHRVRFLYLDPNSDKTKDYEFDARCHFIPRIGDKLEIGKDKTAFVKSIYHRFLQADGTWKLHIDIWNNSISSFQD